MYEQARLTKILEAKDSLDHKIMSQNLNMIVGLKIESFIVTDKKKYESYFSHIFEVTQSLYKANSHRRNYLKKEVKTIKEFKRSSRKNPNTADLGINPIELNTEIEGVLIHVKAALDSLAKSLDSLLGFNLGGWNKKGEGKESGRKIIEAIDHNLPEELKEKAKGLREHIEMNIPAISYIVFLRDGAPHRGGIKNITDIVYQQARKRVIPQMIRHEGDVYEKVGDYLTRLLTEISSFTQGVTLLSLLVRTPSGLSVIKNRDGQWPPYYWNLGEISDEKMGEIAQSSEFS